MPATDFSDSRVQQVLESRDVATLATLQPSGMPLAVAMWFVHDARGLAMISANNVQKVRNIRRDPRVSVAVETQHEGSLRCVTIQGRAEFVEEAQPRRPLLDALFEKYQSALEHRWSGREMPADRVLFHIVADKVFYWGPDA